VVCQDVLDLELDEPADVVVSTAALHWRIRSPAAIAVNLGN
jgi:hypothetical protein